MKTFFAIIGAISIAGSLMMLASAFVAQSNYSNDK